MHFTMIVALPTDENIYNVLEPYCESMYDRDDKGVYGPDEQFYPDGEGAPYTFYDWLEVGGRRDGYIKGKRGRKPLKECKPHEDYPEINWKDRGSMFYKKDIKGFGYDEKNLSKYPQLHSYYDPNYIEENGCLPEWPDKWQFMEDWNDESTLNEEAFEKAKKEYDEGLMKWYDEIPDDYVIYLIDYHN